MEDDQNKKKQIGVIKNYKIMLVNGTIIRDKEDDDFVGGGNPSRYGYVPDDEIWIERSLPPGDIAPFIVHEIHECELMKKGLSYEQAHEIAARLETMMRTKQPNLTGIKPVQHAATWLKKHENESSSVLLKYANTALRRNHATPALAKNSQKEHVILQQFIKHMILSR